MTKLFILALDHTHSRKTATALYPPPCPKSTAAKAYIFFTSHCSISTNVCRDFR